MSMLDGQDRIAGSIQKTNSRDLSESVKRAFDLMVVALLLPVTAPVIAVLYLLSRLDGGPGFFGHARIGKNNAQFKCWKIRSMVPDAEKLLVAHLANNPAAAQEWQRDFKLTDDPRVTRLGRFIRATSLDELPQIWNVLRGDMSIVGPRPVTHREIEKYQGYEWCYLSVKPGITGLWQVSGRNDVSYEERVRLDLEYFDTQTLLMDISIILRTASAVLNRTGR